MNQEGEETKGKKTGQAGFSISPVRPQHPPSHAAIQTKPPPLAWPLSTTAHSVHSSVATSPSHPVPPVRSFRIPSPSDGESPRKPKPLPSIINRTRACLTRQQQPGNRTDERARRFLFSHIPLNAVPSQKPRDGDTAAEERTDMIHTILPWPPPPGGASRGLCRHAVRP